MTDTSFEIVGAHAVENQTVTVKKKWFQGKPVVSIVLLGMVLLGCLFAEAIMTKDPTYMDLLIIIRHLEENFCLVQILWEEIFFP